MPIDAQTRKQVVETTADKLEKFYVRPEIARKMAARLRAKESAGGYDLILSSASLAKELTDDIRSVRADLHTYVLYSFGIIKDPPRDAAQGPPPGAIRSNFGFRRVEILDGNVGYIDLRGFAKPAFAAKTAAAAMNFVANSVALILDVRNNPGGDGGMVQMLCSYFFGPNPVHLADEYEREGDKTTEIWTLPDPPGSRYLSRPVFILTSRLTFSAAEEFAYNLQSQKRATVVGERTAGGAYGGGRQGINPHFDLLLSISRTTNAVTGKDWQGSGVQPDLPVPAEQALDAALAAAHR